MSSSVMAVLTAHVVVFIDPHGFASTTSDILTPVQYWEKQLKTRKYPMNITIEYVNVNPINTFDLTTAVKIAQPIIKARLLNMTLPKATVILGPDFEVGKKAGGLIPTYLPYKGNMVAFFLSFHFIINNSSFSLSICVCIWMID
jgi:hypothetical protein